MKIYITVLCICIGMLCWNCDPPTKESENSDLSSDSKEENKVLLETGASTWYTYEGTVPCRDCAGIKMVLRLENKPDKKEREYELTETYLETAEGDRLFETQGLYDVTYGIEGEPGAMVITLLDNNKAIKSFVQEQSGDLTLLNQQNNRIKSPLNYSLEKK